MEEILIVQMIVSELGNFMNKQDETFLSLAIDFFLQKHDIVKLMVRRDFSV